MQPTVHQEFKREYPRTLRFSLAAAAVLVPPLLLLLIPVGRFVMPDPVPPLRLVNIEVLDTPPGPEAIKLPRIPVVHFDPADADVIPVDTPIRTDPLGSPPAPATDDPTLNPFDRAPHPIRMRRPEYPEFARLGGIEGRVTVRLRIDRDGHVMDAFIVESDFAVFEAPTLEAIREWRFEPARKAGRPVGASIVFPIEFRLI